MTPSLTTPCGRDRCKHTFGEHYTRFDGKGGCSHIESQYWGGTGPSDDYGVNYLPCDCKAFLIVETKEYTIKPQIDWKEAESYR